MKITICIILVTTIITMGISPGMTTAEMKQIAWDNRFLFYQFYER
jgi:hypothetical protein